MLGVFTDMFVASPAADALGRATGLDFDGDAGKLLAFIPLAVTVYDGEWLL